MLQFCCDYRFTSEVVIRTICNNNRLLAWAEFEGGLLLNVEVEVGGGYGGCFFCSSCCGWILTLMVRLMIVVVLLMDKGLGDGLWFC